MATRMIVSTSEQQLRVLTKDYQEHDGEVDGKAPHVQYNYGDTPNANSELTRGMRLKSIAYPDGRLVHFTYGSSGSDADNLNRLDAIKATVAAGYALGAARRSPHIRIWVLR